MSKHKNLLVCFISIILSTLFTTFCVTGIVRGQSNNDLYINETYYHELEQQYRKDIITFLNTNGFQNSGVMITRIIDEDQIREYQIKIHHDRFVDYNDLMKESIRKEILEKAFLEDNCIFNIIFNS